MDASYVLGGESCASRKRSRGSDLHRPDVFVHLRVEEHLRFRCAFAPDDSREVERQRPDGWVLRTLLRSGSDPGSDYSVEQYLGRRRCHTEG